jgi:hypothetical protein
MRFLGDQLPWSGGDEFEAGEEFSSKGRLTASARHERLVNDIDEWRHDGSRSDRRHHLNANFGPNIRFLGCSVGGTVFYTRRNMTFHNRQQVARIKKVEKIRKAVVMSLKGKRLVVCVGV